MDSTDQNLPCQTTNGSDGVKPKRGRRKKLANFSQPVKIGMERFVGKSKSDFINQRLARRRILTVPQHILDANPDKHFCFVNMNKLQKHGMWHPGGYRLYNLTNSDSENLHDSKFNKALDNYLHRNEMALAWIPKEEYEARVLEDQIVRNNLDVTDLIKKNPDLKSMSPHAKQTSQVLPYPEVQKKE